jgi:hypothetical protein
MRRFFCSCVIFVSITTPASLAAEVPLAGCYEHAYDKTHLAVHKGQIVTRAIVWIKATDLPRTPDFRDMIADADFLVSVKGSKDKFVSHGSCWSAKGGLSCNGSLSAADADTCKVKTTGARDCRVNLADAGGFDIASRPDGVLVSISDRLELVQKPYDGGPFLNLSGKDPQNRGFLLKPVPIESCK